MNNKSHHFFASTVVLTIVFFSMMSVGRAQTPALDSEESSFLTLINNYRAQNGLGPLQVSIALENSSLWMANDLATKNYFSHTDSLGRDPFTRMAAFGYPYAPAGENIAAGNATAQNTFTQWQTACDPDGSGNCTYAHRQNMLNPSYVVMGIGRANNAGSMYGWYWVTDFGAYLDATINTTPDLQAPTVPTLMSATAKSATEVDLTWSASTDNVGVAGYQISRNGSVLTTVSGSALSYANTGVSASTTYSYTIKAYDAAGNYSASSNSIQVTTPASVNGVNLSQGKAATQSSTYAGYPTTGASSAVDGNTDGTFSHGSVSHTNADSNAWWQVDLGTAATISSIAIWNRTDCCGDRLSDYWVFVSNTPFAPTDTPTTLQGRAGTWSSHQTSYPNPSTTLAMNAQGRYVRVQLSGTNYLALAEVQVFGSSTGTTTYGVSGQVTLAGAGLNGVTMTLSGSQSASISTSGSGSYSFTGLAAGSYTVTPSLSGYSFTPPSQTFSNLSASQTANFTATSTSTYQISGQVTLAGAGLNGVSVTLSGSQSGSVNTSGTGSYSFTGLATGSYTVTPSLSGYSFTPPSQTFSNLSASQTANFTATSTSTYQISGQVTLAGAGLNGVSVTLSGSQSGSVNTSGTGSYSFTGLATGSYTVTPSLNGYSFTPPSQTFSNLSASQTANFTATSTSTYQISGQVTLAGAGLNGVSVTLSGSQSGSVNTSGTGSYSFTGLAAGSYTVTPSLSGYSFTPPSQTFASLSASQAANFTATVVTSGNLAVGKAATQSSTYAGYATTVASSAVDGNTDGTFSHGSVSHTNADANAWWQVDLGAPATISSITIWNRSDCCSDRLSDYWVFASNTPFVATDIPSTLQGRAGTWSSHQTSYPNPSTTVAVNAQGRYVRVQLSGTNYLALTEVQVFGSSTGTTTYGISGQVTLSGAGLNGVAMTLSGSQSGSMNTSGSGNYSFTGLAAAGSYTVTPSLSGYSFTPPSQTFSNLSASQTAGFTATATATTYQISGQVTLAGVGLNGVSVTLSGSQSGAVNTSGSGNFSFTGLAAAGSYTVTPTLSGYSFNPPSQTFSNLSASQTANFTATATATTYQISGQVTLAGVGLNGVSVTLSGSQSGAVNTSGSGNFSFTGLAAAGSYTVTPSLSGYSFSPPSQTFSNLSASQTANFTATTVANTNLAVGKPATESSTYGGYATTVASSAVDGNTDGTFSHGSVSHTNSDSNAWWQVDLGASATIGSITIWNRTDCCGDRLSDYWVFVSNTPFAPTDTPTTLQSRAGTWSSHQTSYPNPSTTIAANAQGRYVRVQLSGTNYLSMAEVQIFGHF